MSHSPDATSPLRTEYDGTFAFESGSQFGALYAREGRQYGKVNGAYPSNPYAVTDERCEVYNAGYEDGFNGR